jgi:hypothetical protein
MGKGNGRKRPAGGRQKKPRVSTVAVTTDDIKTEVPPTVITSALDNASATATAKRVSNRDNSDLSADTFDFLDIVPRMHHAFVPAGETTLSGLFHIVYAEL